ncbi:MAG TPA: helix-turn-helix domain-containing protein [Chitinophagales bacterium]|nr:helix-turn-helix domain-containing protein [Chitinophagales bacterium]
MSSTIKVEKTCQHCGKKFIAQNTTTKCCAHRCASAAYKKRERTAKVEADIQKENELKPFNPIVTQKEFLSVKETCQLIGASRWTIYRLIDRGTLRASKLGSRTIIARTEINNLFK